MSTNVIASQPTGRLPDPGKPADSMLTAPILPTLVRLSMPNMMAMLAMALVTIAETAYVGSLGTPPLGDIIQNAIDLYTQIGLGTPRVARRESKA